MNKWKWKVPSEIKLNRYIYWRETEILKKFLNGKGKLLECGCNPAKYLIHFNKVFGYTELYGVDAEDVAPSLQNLKHFGVNARIIRADVLNLPYKDSCFDVVFSAGLIEHFKNPFEPLKEMHRVTRKILITFVPVCYGFRGFVRKRIEDRASGASFKEHYIIREQHFREWFSELNEKPIIIPYGFYTIKGQILIPRFMRHLENRFFHHGIACIVRKR